MPSYSSIHPIVIAYSYHVDRPIDLTDFVDSINVKSSIISSTVSSATIVLDKSKYGEVVTLGDWMQITLASTAQRAEETIFFGYVTDISYDATATGSGHRSTKSTIKLADFSAILNKTVDNGKAWAFYYGSGANTADTSEKNTVEKNLPSLASLMMSVSQSNRDTKQMTVPTSPLMVEMFLEFFIVWGGTFFNNYMMPKSWGNGESRPLQDFLCKQNKRRKNWSSDRLAPGRVEIDLAQSEFYHGDVLVDSRWTSKIKDLKVYAKASKALDAAGLPGSAFAHDSGEVVRDLDRQNNLVAWRVNTDWYEIPDTLPYVLPTRSAEATKTIATTATGVQSASSWQSAMIWSDPGWNEMFTSLVEHCQWPSGQAGHAKTGGGAVTVYKTDQTPVESQIQCTNGKIYNRTFLPTICLRPVLHPVYYGLRIPGAEKKTGKSKKHIKMEHEWWSHGQRKGVETEWGKSVTAYSGAYEAHCTKWMVDVNTLTSLNLNQSAKNAYNYFTCVDNGGLSLKTLVEQKGVKPFSGSLINEVSGGRMPIVVEGLKSRFGLNFLETTTLYSYLQSTDGKKADLSIDALVLKNYLQFSWNVKNLEYYSGAVTFPMFDINVPRPGDVGYIMGEPESKNVVGAGGKSRVELNNTYSMHAQTGLLPKFNRKELCLSLYTESVTINLKKSRGMFLGTVACVFSRGDWVTIHHGDAENKWSSIKQRISKQKSSYTPVAEGFSGLAVAEGLPLHAKGVGDDEVYFRFVDGLKIGFRPNYWLPEIPGISKEMSQAIVDIYEDVDPGPFYDDNLSVWWGVLSSQERDMDRVRNSGNFYSGRPSYPKTTTPISMKPLGGPGDGLTQAGKLDGITIKASGSWGIEKYLNALSGSTQNAWPELTDPQDGAA